MNTSLIALTLFQCNFKYIDIINFLIDEIFKSKISQYTVVAS